MLRAVLDANVYVSAVLRPGRPPGRIIEAFLRAAPFEIVLTPSIVEEVHRALNYPKVRRYIRGRIDAQLWFEDIVVLAELMPGEYECSGVCPDPDDDKYLAAAMEARAAFVVTGDRAFLSVAQYEDVHIVTPREFLAVLTDLAAQ